MAVLLDAQPDVELVGAGPQQLVRKRHDQRNDGARMEHRRVEIDVGGDLGSVETDRVA